MQQARQGGHAPSVSPCAWWANHALALTLIVLALPGLPGGMWQIVILAVPPAGAVAVVGFCSLIS